MNKAEFKEYWYANAISEELKADLKSYAGGLGMDVEAEIGNVFEEAWVIYQETLLTTDIADQQNVHGYINYRLGMSQVKAYLDCLQSASSSLEATRTGSFGRRVISGELKSIATKECTFQQHVI